MAWQGGLKVNGEFTYDVVEDEGLPAPLFVVESVVEQERGDEQHLGPQLVELDVLRDWR